MRDWLISRQRYWGAPIPIIHCEKDGAVAVPEKDLPVVLPEVEDYAPKGDGKSVLASQTDWVNTTCPTCGGPAKRETDTMDGYACSSWYLLRYTDPHNDVQAWDPKLANYWAPLDMYVGGDHAVAHLLYVRFWTHVFYDMGLTSFKEPVKKLVYHGLIQAEDGTKMSKSKGNVVDPLDVIDQGYGADALRTLELFLGPIDENSNWSSGGIAGMYRFLNRVWTLTQEYIESDKSNTSHDDEVRRLRHKLAAKVTDDYHRLSFNTAIAAMMEYVNDLYKLKVDGFSNDVWKDALETLLKLLAPMAPHIASELWQQLGNDGLIEHHGWPEWNDSLIVEDTMTIIVQVNGKLRAKLTIPRDAAEDDIKAEALADDNVLKFTEGKEPRKVIYVPGRLVNIAA
jgi:leucyl-tRNA synthetase